jgi:ubiquinone/menaquinone biosynthesis C-methylase UbiE
VTTTPNIDELKARQRATWSAGNYDLIAQRIAAVGEVVAEAAQIEPGMAVLDVATGTGNAAIPAAVAGANVTGLDLTPELFDAARAHAGEAGVTIEWVEGDAEALPFEDESFDRVLSVFGVMFAPRQRVAAAELARVCRSGGSVVVASWTPQGFTGRLFATLGRHLPAPAAGGSSPVQWGDERHVRTLIGGQLLLAQERRTVDLRGPSRDAMIAMYDHAFGPFVLARRALGDARFAVVLEDVRALVEEFDQGEGELHIEAEYLLTVAHRP